MNCNSLSFFITTYFLTGITLTQIQVLLRYKIQNLKLLEDTFQS